MKTKTLARFIIVILLMTLGANTLFAQESDVDQDHTGWSIESNTCADDENIITSGQTVTADASEALAAHIDIVEITTTLSGQTLTVVFHLRDVPEALTFDRTGVPDRWLEYAWKVSIDVDNNPETGFGGLDYDLSASHLVFSSESDRDITAPIGSKVQVDTWEWLESSASYLEPASMEVSPQADTITLSGEIPGITSESRLVFEAYDYVNGSDKVACLFPSSQSDTDQAVGDKGRSASAQEPEVDQDLINWIIESNTCADDENIITPGQTVTADASEALAAHIDIVEVTTTLSGQTLTVVFHLRDVPEALTFDRTGVRDRRLEYEWTVSIDVDNDLETGFGGLDYDLSASHFVGVSGRNITAPIENTAQANTGKRHENFRSYLGPASIEVSPQADTITLSGEIPGITSESRLVFEAYDYVDGSDKVGCLFPSSQSDTDQAFGDKGRSASAQEPEVDQDLINRIIESNTCADDENFITSGQTVTADASEALAAHIDIVEVTTTLSGQTLTVVFHLRDVPEALTFDRNGVRDRRLEYAWKVSIDVDNDLETGFGGLDYDLSANHTVFPSASGRDITAPIENKAQANTGKWHESGAFHFYLEPASMEVSPQADTITLSGEIPGITSESQLVFEAYDYVNGSDKVGCLFPSSQSATHQAYRCDPDDTMSRSTVARNTTITPGQTVADDASDALAAHIDIVEVNTTLSGQTLTVVFHLRDVPEALTFDRTGVPDNVPDNVMEYAWTVSIDVDNNLETEFGGLDYDLSASHFVGVSGRNITAPIENTAQANTGKRHENFRSYLGRASMEVSPQADTITLSGEIPGITSESQLVFEAYDYVNGSDKVGCLFPSSQSATHQAVGDKDRSVSAQEPGVDQDRLDWISDWIIESNMCDPDDATIAPGQTVADDASDALDAHIDIVEVNTTLSGQTLTVVFHLRDVPEALTFDRTGMRDRRLEYEWTVSIDVDNNLETGFGGLDYDLSASHFVGVSGRNITAPIEDKVQVDTMKRHESGPSYLGPASIEVSPQADTITLSGEIPGITSESRLVFQAYGYANGSDKVVCLFPSAQSATDQIYPTWESED